LILFIVENFPILQSFINGGFFICHMGGAKKKGAASMEKSQDDAKAKESGGKKDRKDKKGEKTERKAEITVILAEDQALKLIKSNNYLTIQELAKQTGVKISAANACLVELLKKGSVKRAGGFSGHWIYQSA
jgi:small subunit ribosomal protein S25e